MRTIARRLSQLERRMTPSPRRRAITRFIGPGSEKYPQYTQEEMDASDVVTFQFVSACEGRQETQCRRAASGLEECQDLCQGMGISQPGRE